MVTNKFLKLMSILLIFCICFIFVFTLPAKQVQANTLFLRYITAVVASCVASGLMFTSTRHAQDFASYLYHKYSDIRDYVHSTVTHASTVFYLSLPFYTYFKDLITTNYSVGLNEVTDTYYEIYDTDIMNTDIPSTGGWVKGILYKGLRYSVRSIYAEYFELVCRRANGNTVSVGTSGRHVYGDSSNNFYIDDAFHDGYYGLSRIYDDGKKVYIDIHVFKNVPGEVPVNYSCTVYGEPKNFDVTDESGVQRDIDVTFTGVNGVLDNPNHDILNDFDVRLLKLENTLDDYINKGYEDVVVNEPYDSNPPVGSISNLDLQVYDNGYSISWDGIADYYLYYEYINGVKTLIDTLDYPYVERDLPIVYPLDIVIDGYTNGVLTHSISRIFSSSDSGVNDYTGVLSNILTGVNSLAQSVVNFFDLSRPIDFSPLQMSGQVFTTKFPFSLPWDLFRSVEAFEHTGNKPQFNINLGGLMGNTGLNFDFSMFDSIVNYVRVLEVIFFDISLILITRRLLGGAS